MENKIKFRLPEKIFIKIRNLSFKIIAYKNFISFLVNPSNVLGIPSSYIYFWWELFIFSIDTWAVL